MTKLDKQVIISSTNILDKLLKDNRIVNVEGYVKVFYNCREQGYKFLVSGKSITRTICFSQDRDKNNIVVYSNNKYEQYPYSIDFWNSCKYFSYNDITEVIDYICNLCLFN